MWKTNLGVETKIIAEENKLFLDHRHGDANLQIFWFKWGADYPDVTSFLGVFTTQSSANDFHYSNPAFDDLLSQADNARDARARVLLLQKAEALLVGDNAAIPLFTQTRQYLVKPWVQGFRKNAIGNSMDQDVHIVPHI
jgi:oligopeptide transport system substrate-binding protein